MLVKPVATTVMDTDVKDSCVKVTVPDPEGNPTVGTGRSWPTVATNCLLQRLGMETAISTAAALTPKFEPSNVMDCKEAIRCAADTKVTVGAAGNRSVAESNAEFWKLKIFVAPNNDNSSVTPAASLA